VKGIQLNNPSEKKLCCFKYGMMGLLFFFAQAQAQRDLQSTCYDFPPLERKIQEWVDSGYYSGASVLITKDNKVIYKSHFGNYKPETVVFNPFLSSPALAFVVRDIVNKKNSK